MNADIKIDLLNPDKEQLLLKWKDELAAVDHLNRWDLNIELSWWAEYSSTRNDILELGAYNGASTKIMSLANPNSHITVIDLWEDEGTFETFKNALNQEIDDDRVSFQRSTTEEGLTRLIDALLKNHCGILPFDGCMIDAGHLEHLVDSDISLSSALMVKGSLICGHDYHPSWDDNGVSKAVKKAFPGDRHSNPIGSIWAAIVE